VGEWDALRGRLIAIEGIEQAGKETVSRLLGATLTAAGLRVERQEFPDLSSPVGEQIGRFLSGGVQLRTEVRQLLYVANRWERNEQLVQWLSEDATVLLDRYTGSGLAYGAAQGLSMEWMETLEQGLPKPDIVILLDITPEVSLARKRNARDAYERQEQLLTRARAAYLNLAQHDNWAVINAASGPHEVWSAVELVLKEHFPAPAEEAPELEILDNPS
jgi:dTMP kinase